MTSEFSSCTRLPFIPKLTLQHSSGQIWTVLTFDSNKNVLNVILLSWNLTHKHTKMKIFKTFSLGAIKVWGCTESNSRVSDPPVWVKSNKMKLVLLGNYKIEKLYLPYMPVCNFFWDSGDRVQGGTWHCHESCLCSYHTCPGSHRHRHLLVFEGSWENLERVKQHRSDDVWCTKRAGVLRRSIYSTKWDLI